MQLIDEFLELYGTLSEAEKRSLAALLSLTNNYSSLLPVPKDFDDASLSSFVSTFETLTNKITHF